MEIIKGRIPSAKKVVIYGPEGIGKSTLAAQFPTPVFIDTEGSTKDMDVARTPAPSSWAMLMEQAKYFAAHPDGFKTLVIDTSDWAEQLCVADVCARYQKAGIEDFGYGKGYTYLQEEFGRLLNLLTDLVEKNHLNIVLNAHAKMRKFEQPDELGSYDRWEMKLTKQVAPMVKEWADMVLFCNYKTIVVNVDGQGAQKGRNKVQGGRRVAYTTHHSCWDAKNRYGLPEEIPMGYEGIRHVIEGGGQPEAQAPADMEPSMPQSQAARPERGEAPAEKSGPADPEKKGGGALPEGRKEEPGGASGPKVDPRVPKALRDLMAENGVDEWDVQGVVGAKGYFPADMPVWGYPEEFVEGCLVAKWSDKVYPMIKEMKAQGAIIFN